MSGNIQVAQLEKRWLSPLEAGAVMNLGKTKIYALIKSGELRTFKAGRARRVPIEAINELASRLESGGQA